MIHHLNGRKLVVFDDLRELHEMQNAMFMIQSHTNDKCKQFHIINDAIYNTCKGQISTNSSLSLQITFTNLFMAICTLGIFNLIYCFTEEKQFRNAFSDECNNNTFLPFDLIFPLYNRK